MKTKRINTPFSELFFLQENTFDLKECLVLLRVLIRTDEDAIDTRIDHASVTVFEQCRVLGPFELIQVEVARRLIEMKCIETVIAASKSCL